MRSVQSIISTLSLLIIFVMFVHQGEKFMLIINSNKCSTNIYKWIKNEKKKNNKLKNKIFFCLVKVLLTNKNKNIFI